MWVLSFELICDSLESTKVLTCSGTCKVFELLLSPFKFCEEEGFIKSPENADNIIILLQLLLLNHVSLALNTAEQEDQDPYLGTGVEGVIVPTT